jgi:ABC-type antimicrobial peptide transport system ATPase subunit
MNNEIEKKKGKINMQLRSSNYYLNSEKETQKILNIKLKLNLNNENDEKKVKEIVKKIFLIFLKKLIHHKLFIQLNY